jgi:cytochrome c oxidase assembly factor CtaG
MSERLRPLFLIAAGLLLVVVVVPPLSTEARRYEFVEAVQFALAALAVPVLVVLGAPWALLGLAGSGSPEHGVGPVDRLAAARVRHPELVRTLAFVIIDFAVAAVWRTPVAVDAVVDHPWLIVVEAISLAVAGVGFWLELIASPPLAPRLPRPWRAALAALAMWLMWLMAYVLGLSHASWYHAYHRLSGAGLSFSADQQISTALLWLAAACAFFPVIFWDLIVWLKSEDDPDAELHRLIRAERRAQVRPTASSEGDSAGGKA